MYWQTSRPTSHFLVGPQGNVSLTVPDELPPLDELLLLDEPPLLDVEPPLLLDDEPPLLDATMGPPEEVVVPPSLQAIAKASGKATNVARMNPIVRMTKPRGR